MIDAPYIYRLLALAAFVCLALLYDRRNAREKRYRKREYSFLLAVGAFGAVFGVLIDTVTSSISPVYFVAWKGLSDGPGFRAAVTTLGAQAGFSAGLLGAGILLVVNSRRRDLALLLQYVALSFACSALTAATLGLLQHHFQLFELTDWASLFDPSERQSFKTVWCVHLGVYVGGLIGLLFSCIRIRSERRSACPADGAGADRGARGRGRP